MKVLWFTNIMLPEYARALGLSEHITGGWLTGLINAVRKYAPEIELTVVPVQCIAEPKEINGVSHRTMIPLKGRLYAPKNRKEFVDSMRRCIKDINPDIIHFHGSEYCLQEYYRETNLRYHTVTSIQGILAGCLPYCTGGLNSYQVNCERTFTDKLLRRWSIDDTVMDYTKRAEVELGILRRGGNFMGRTDWDRQWIAATNSASRYFHVGEVLRPEFYQKHRRNPTNVVPHRIYCGAAFKSMLKGGHVLIEAIAMLRDKYPDIKVCVANAISYSRRGLIHNVRMGYYERYMRAQIRRLGIWRQIEYLPPLTAAQVIDQLKMAELYVLPSYIENSPNSLGEAMLLRTPVIATDVGGVASMLSRECGTLVHAGDPADLACAIEAVFNDREAAKDKAERAYMSAIERFNIKGIVQALKSAYEQIVRSDNG